MLLFPICILAMANPEERLFMEVLYKKHYLLMRNVARDVLKEPEIADDIISDSCMRLIQNVATLMELAEQELKSYIATTVRNTAIDYYRKHARRREVSIHALEETQEDARPQADVEHQIALEGELRDVLIAIEALPELERQVIKMKFYYGMSDREIAESTGLSVNSIAKYISRARAHLKEILYAKEAEPNE